MVMYLPTNVTSLYFQVKEKAFASICVRINTSTNKLIKTYLQSKQQENIKSVEVWKILQTIKVLHIRRRETECLKQITFYRISAQMRDHVS